MPKYDPKVVMDLSIFQIGGWKIGSPVTRACWKNSRMGMNQWLLVGIPDGDPFFVTQFLKRHCRSSDQHMKKLMLMSLREGLHVIMQWYMQQHFADCFRVS